MVFLSCLRCYGVLFFWGGGAVFLSSFVLHATGTARSPARCFLHSALCLCCVVSPSSTQVQDLSLSSLVRSVFSGLTLSSERDKA